MSDVRCEVPGCERPHRSKGYCHMHAERVRRAGHPGLNGRHRTSLEDRLWAKVDRSGGEAACWPFSGTLNLGYGQIRSGPKGSPMIYAHRAAWLVTHSDAPAPEMLDHLCHDPELCHGVECLHRRCCNPAHLKPATAAENNAPGRRYAPTTIRKREHE